MMTLLFYVCTSIECTEIMRITMMMGAYVCAILVVLISNGIIHSNIIVDVLCRQLLVH